MMRILFVHLNGCMSGAEQSLLLLVKHISKMHDVVVACPDNGTLSDKLAHLSIPTVAIAPLPKRRLRSPATLVYGIKLAHRLYRLIRRVEPDLIHANSFYAASVVVTAGALRRKPVVVHARDFVGFPLLSRVLGHLSKRILAVSQAVKDDLVGQGVPPEKIEVVYNGVDVEASWAGDTLPAESGAEGGTTGKELVFANIGQFVPWKNQKVFVEAAVNTSQHLAHARFLLVGDDLFGRDGVYREGLIELAARASLDCGTGIELVGWQQDMRAVWNRIDCLVHTATREPFGRVLIEAMARGIPVIAFDACGPREIITNGDTGILAESGNVGQLVDAMIRVATDRPFAETIARNGYHSVSSRFSQRETARAVERVYREVLN